MLLWSIRRPEKAGHVGDKAHASVQKTKEKDDQTK